MFDRILLAVDGSEHSRKAAEIAGDLGRTHHAEVVVLHVREHELTWGSAVDAETSDEATDLVDGVVRKLKEDGTAARGEVRRAPLGSTPREVLAVAEEEGADLIVMGTRGLTEWGSLLMGSVAHKVLHLASCPVLVVR
jgi:nucleotide-binding universal stress UspA family protein